jgi:hypothetical protein
LVQAFESSAMMSAQIRSQSPVFEDVDSITDRILNTVAGLKRYPEETSLAALMNRILNLAMLPAVQRIALTLILIIAAVFIYQQAYIYSNTAKLEMQLSNAGKSALADKASKDMQDCLKNSEHYLSKVKTGKIIIGSKMKMDISKNPEVLRKYASFFCSHRYGYLKNSLKENIIFIPDL